MAVMETPGSYIAHLLRLRSMTQRDLATACGYSPQYVNDFVKNRKTLTPKMADAFAKVLHADRTQLHRVGAWAQGWRVE